MSALEVQKAVIGALKANSGVTAIVATRIYDAVPTNATFPYISYGPDTETPQRAGCYDGSEVIFQIDIWSRSVGYPQAKQIAAAVRGALHEQELELDNNRLVDLAETEARTLRDPDGLTTHAALTFRAVTEPV